MFRERADTLPAGRLTSAQNPLLKDVRKAIAQGTLTSGGCCVAEGFHLLEEAVRSGCAIDVVLAADSAVDAIGERVPGYRGRVTSLPDALFDRVASTATTQGVIALVRPPEWRIHQVVAGESLVVVLDGVQDAGNAGAILRAAEAFGATGAIFLRGSASPFHAKTLRASAGSAFRMALVAGVAAGEAIDVVRESGIALFAASASAALVVTDADLTRRAAIVVGSEGRGVSEAVRSAATGIRVPTIEVESLNVAVAAGILFYEARRQRERRP